MKTAVAQDKPFFVACNFWGPHAPYILPEQYMRMYDPKAVAPPRTSCTDLAGKPQLHSDYSSYWGVHNFTPQQWSELMAACYGYISLIDEQVGRMLACLDELGVADETTVIFTSDHGGMVGSHGLMDKGPFLYDDVCRVPMIVRPAGAARTARRDEHIVYNMDLMATFVELAGAAAGTGLDATSLVPLWTDREAEFPSRPAAFCEYHGHQVPAFGRMIRTERAKYVFNACGCDEFYDLDADPDERANLIDGPARRDEIAEMRISLADYLAGQGDPALPFFCATRLSG